MKTISTMDLLAAARQMNEDLAHSRYDDREIIMSARRLSKLIYECEPHWHSMTGQCVVGKTDYPFEVYMKALSLITTVWVTDIYLRKARDRQIPQMKERFTDYQAFMNHCMDDARQVIDAERDLDAEAAWKKIDRRPASWKNRLRCRINRLKWGH
ncbi:MAG: hypothetical protein PHE59_04910 [Patescibacteria group bacterium]|nr:hypothetical protein [Patescibacteria group bacterium]